MRNCDTCAQCDNGILDFFFSIEKHDIFSVLLSIIQQTTNICFLFILLFFERVGDKEAVIEVIVEKGFSTNTDQIEKRKKDFFFKSEYGIGQKCRSKIPLKKL